MRTLFRVVLACIVIVASGIICWERNNYDPAFGYQVTTWDGHPAYGQINPNGWYTFYYWSEAGPGPIIGSFPQGEALYLH